MDTAATQTSAIRINKIFRVDRIFKGGARFSVRARFRKLFRTERAIPPPFLADEVQERGCSALPRSAGSGESLQQVPLVPLETPMSREIPSQGCCAFPRSPDRRRRLAGIRLSQVRDPLASNRATEGSNAPARNPGAARWLSRVPFPRQSSREYTPGLARTVA